MGHFINQHRIAETYPVQAQSAAVVAGSQSATNQNTRWRSSRHRVSLCPNNILKIIRQSPFFHKTQFHPAKSSRSASGHFCKYQHRTNSAISTGHELEQYYFSGFLTANLFPATFS